MSDFIEPQSTPVDSVIPPIQKFNEFSSGAGATTFKANKEGIFAGADNYTDAPWKLSYTGVNTIGPNGEILIDGPNGTITTNHIKDATYGLNGVFCYTHKSTNTAGTWSFSTGVPDTGGLLNATLNYIDGSGFYKLLPGFNTASLNPYYYIYKSGGFYRVFYYAGNIYGDVTYSSLYFTLFFNSLEASGW